MVDLLRRMVVTHARKSTPKTPSLHTQLTPSKGCVFIKLQKQNQTLTQDMNAHAYSTPFLAQLVCAFAQLFEPFNPRGF